jgi:predicted  nucleic acid-binding Zn-ribbon protein
VSDFPTLGFDPAPGRLQSVDDLATKLTKAVKGLDSAHTTLTEISKGGKTWEGEAASAFAEKVSDLPKYLADSRDALRSAATQLSRWRTKLADFQDKAREYEADAKAAKEKQKTREAAHDRATTAYNAAAANPALRLAGQVYTNQADLAGAQAKYDTASAHLTKADTALDTATKQLDSARTEFEDIVKKAEELLEYHQQKAQTIADMLTKANDKAPDPGFFEGLADAFTKFGHKIQNWCTKNADLLKGIGDWLSIASSALGVASLLTLWCPPLAGALALASAGLSLGALATHGAAKLGGADVGVMDLVGDGIGVVPFGKFGSVAMKGAKVPMKLAQVEGRTVASVDRVNKIRALRDAGFTGRALEGRSLLGMGDDYARGSKVFTATGAGDRVKLAWNSHVQDVAGASIKEAGLSKGLTKVLDSGLTPEAVKTSLSGALRADGSIDPLSWWSKGPQLAQQVPGIGIDAHTQLTDPGTPAAGRL